VLERSQNPTQTARMYIMKTAESDWLVSLLEIASTRDGRRDLIVAMREAARQEHAEDRDGADDVTDLHRRITPASLT